MSNNNALLPKLWIYDVKSDLTAEKETVSKNELNCAVFRFFWFSVFRDALNDKYQTLKAVFRISKSFIYTSAFPKRIAFQIFYHVSRCVSDVLYWVDSKRKNIFLEYKYLLSLTRRCRVNWHHPILYPVPAAFSKAKSYTSGNCLKQRKTF